MKIAMLSTDNRQDTREYHRPDPYFGTAPEALFEGLATIPELEVHIISCVQRPMPAPSRLAPNLHYHSLHVPQIGWLRTGYQGCIRAVRKRLRDIQPNLVHAQGTERDCALSAAFSGYPNILTIHGNMRHIADQKHARPFSYHWLAARLEDVALRRTCGVLCNSAYTESLVQSRTRKTWRVPNALRGIFLSPLPGVAKPTASPQTVPILLSVGSITPLKRQVELLDLARELHASGARFELQFVGALDPASNYGRQFLDRIAPAQAAGFARHLGTLTAPELVPLFDRASALVHFSREESFGLVVAEALARNLKIFATRVGGIVDIAQNIEAAELFPVDDWAGLRDSLKSWLARGHPRPTTAGPEMARRYHPQAIARQHLAIYREIETRRLS